MPSAKVREPIISVLGHVDHGKTTLLDWIRGSVIASREAGGITQHIGATDVPFETVKGICGSLLDAFGPKTKLRGLLFIDTPGHEAFTNLRKRGGSVADLAILVVDINEGLMPQSLESMQILKQYKVPFIIAANKIDRISGWNPEQGLASQQEHVQKGFYSKFYSLVGKLSELGFESDLFSQISDFTKQIAIVPISAKHGKGIPELLMVLIGLSQQYLTGKLTIDPNSPAKGTILEVREDKGLGTTIDVIVYEGVIKKGDSIVVGAKEPILTKVKALLRPKPLDEIRDPRDKFSQEDEVYAAAGVKIAAPGLEDAMAGAPVYVGGAELIGKVRGEIQDVEIDRDNVGLIIKADTIGSLEALIKILQESEIPIKRGTIGKVSNNDVIEASAVGQEDRLLGVILAFNSKVLENAQLIAMDNEVKIFQSNVIYKLLEDYELWVKEERDREKKDLVGKVVTPAKLRFMPDCVFRQNKPAIVGMEVLAGEFGPGCSLLKEDGKVVGRVKEIQSKGETVKSAKKGEQVAVAIENVTVGRQLCEGDIVYPFMSNEDVERVDKEALSEEEKEAMREILRIKKGK
ncbi:MAG: translation initiation factor IF-2 [Candidatus Altiarchaeales archaeon]|nr:translation initiation factor IF-2 [Candidatus Altiarchaeota archaeon]MCG2782671.1 translation initiation factor IF-2 [Candidatus Altiarchaeales archaeon]MBU4266220.1 translation initiation factor IF-2 [Candidatus Altiarchaeota archaeon]MBU4342065.1 translation initiation factor IF-2 [Candidatus Altiarchaeota archaeon]MBU4406055.1 translation initiation factor IF-2 [Candidatus Altiarchaeota archaeon]